MQKFHKIQGKIIQKSWCLTSPPELNIEPTWAFGCFGWILDPPHQGWPIFPRGPGSDSAIRNFDFPAFEFHLTGRLPSPPGTHLVAKRREHVMRPDMLHFLHDTSLFQKVWFFVGEKKSNQFTVNSSGIEWAM